MKNAKNRLCFVYLNNPLGMNRAIRLIKCLYIFSLRQKTPNPNILYVLPATDYSVFDVKAKINASLPSDVINLSKSVDNSANLFRLVVHSEATARFDDINQHSNTWFLG